MYDINVSRDTKMDKNLHSYLHQTCTMCDCYVPFMFTEEVPLHIHTIMRCVNDYLGPGCLIKQHHCVQ